MASDYYLRSKLTLLSLRPKAQFYVILAPCLENGPKEVERNSERALFLTWSLLSPSASLALFHIRKPVEKVQFRYKWKISTTELQVSFCDVCSFNSYNFVLQKGSEGSVGPRGQAGKAGERVSLSVWAGQLLFNIFTWQAFYLWWLIVLSWMI